MQFFSKNGFRIAVVVLIAFLAVPFIFVDKASKPTQQQAAGQSAALPVGISKNPLSRFFNRIAGFYGLKKNNAPEAGGVNNSYEEGGNGNLNSGSVSTVAGSTGGQDNFKVVSEGGVAAGAQNGAAASGASAQNAQGGAQASAQEVQEYVRMDNKTYQVVKDPTGKKYVLTDKGPVGFDDLMKSTVSKEDFEAAKKIAPSLSNEELVYAIHSPYGVKGYMDRKAKGLLTYDDNPNLFGGPAGAGGSSRSMFGGPDGHRMYGGAGGGGVFTASLAAKYAKARAEAAQAKAQAAAAAGSSYSAKGMENGKYTDPKVNALASLIVGAPVIGNAEAASISKAPKSDKVVYGGPGANQNKGEDFILNTNNPTGVIVQGNKPRNVMSADLLGKNFVAKFADPQNKGKEEVNPWIFPTKFDVNKPGAGFSEVNKDTLKNSKELFFKWSDSDVSYAEAKGTISYYKSKIKGLNFLMIDGTQNKGIKLLSPESYHYKVFKGLLGSGAQDVAAGGNINTQKLSTSKTLIVAPNLATANNLKKAGYEVVVFDQYAVTPDRLNKFYTDTQNAITDMSLKQTKAGAEVVNKVKNALSSAKGSGKTRKI